MPTLVLDTAGSALFTAAGAGVGVPKVSSSKPPRRSATGSGAGAGGGAVVFLAGVVRVEFDLTGVDVWETSSSPALYSSY